MKQGRASVSGSMDRKVEPSAQAMNPAGVSQIGQSMGNHATGQGKVLHGTSTSMYAGRGFEAPKDAGCESHDCGSQGRH